MSATGNGYWARVEGYVEAVWIETDDNDDRLV